jgi:two-component system, NarL family, nitrate/nitrite response regulator NarL
MTRPVPRIVIVDDHPVFRRVARELLEERGFTVLGEADCAAAAQSLVEDCAPELAVVDVLLGDESGFDVARVLTRAHPSLGVLLVSSNPDLDDPVRVAQSGARGFLPKGRLASADLDAFWRRSERTAPAARPPTVPWRWGTPQPGVML